MIVAFTSYSVSFMKRLKAGAVSGYLLAAAAYLMWGVLPLYWALLNAVDPFVVLSYRVLFSAFFLLFPVLFTQARTEIKQKLNDKKTLLKVFASALLIFFNWGLFIWGLAQGYHIDVSFGYFVSPLMQVVFGALFLREKMNAGTLAAFLLALAALVYMVVSAGVFPWLSISLAVSFSLYGLVKKKTGIGAVAGLFLETLFVFPISAGILLFFSGHGGIALGRDVLTTVLIVLSGIATALPLLFYGQAAKKITLAAIGFFQYLNPTCMFFIGVFIFREHVEQYKLIGFAFIWAALVLYSASSLIKNRRVETQKV